jgi:hypothetical protein
LRFGFTTESEVIINRSIRPGRSAVWLAHLTGGQGVGGSNPLAPTARLLAGSLLAASLLAAACGPAAKQAPPPHEEGTIPGSVFEDPSYLVILVDAEGTIRVDDQVLLEEQMLDLARERLAGNPDVKAILLVGSSQIQGIHLTARLSEVGYRNVTVYYPTATPPHE